MLGFSNEITISASTEEGEEKERDGSSNADEGAWVVGFLQS